MATVADSWEEMDDVRRVEENLRKLNISTTRKCESSPPNPVPVVLHEDYCRRQYRQDGPQQVRILKRSEDKSAKNDSTSHQRNQTVAKPSKSFQERHAEYQEARLRIMGKTEDPEPAAPVVPPLPLHASQSSPALMSYPPLNGLIGPYPRANGEIVGVNGARISVLRPGEMCPATVMQPMVPLMRTPRGPDGSRGFRSCR